MLTWSSREGAPLIRAVTSTDAAAIASIYNHYVEQTVITFEETPVSAAVIAQRIEAVTAGYPWFVDERDGVVVGYSYATRWHERCSYRLSVETTVYVDARRHRRGAGTALYAALLDALRSRGYHAAVGGIALPNPASVALHEKLGFRKVAHFVEIGRKFDRWIDVGYWQLIL
jgi:L-amino acid N-acyltransferase YncA